ncbi:MAG: metallophosphoesterase family protein [Clostridia bacterium]|nr:metallophosphoesterase family protein [Clostridia bacterium]
MMENAILAVTAARLGIFLGACAVVGLCVFLVCYSLTKRLKVTEVFADVKGTERTEGYARIGLISDLHFPMFEAGRERVVAALEKADVDAVMVAGDLCQNGRGVEQMLEFMRFLAAELRGKTVLVVTGNHDAHHVCGEKEEEIAEYCAKIEACGNNVHVLRNEIERVPVEGLGFDLVVCGFDDMTVSNAETQKELFERAAAETGENGRLVLLMHNPDIMANIKEAVEKSAVKSLTLAGHTHGGQIYMPFNLEFRLLRNDELPKKGYVYGLYDYCANNVLYITCGLGQSFLPIRLGTTPEVAIVNF